MIEALTVARELLAELRALRRQLFRTTEQLAELLGQLEARNA